MIDKIDKIFISKKLPSQAHKGQNLDFGVDNINGYTKNAKNNNKIEKTIMNNHLKVNN